MNEKPTHLDLFSGIGGMHIGFERAGFRTIAFAEIARFPAEVLKRWWPGIPNLGDVHGIERGSIGEVPDVIAGGDPCQENSAARQGVDTVSPSLGSEFIRVVSLFRPRFVLRENPSAVRDDAPWPWWRFRDSLEHLGYLAVPFRIRSCCLGSEHQRERMLVLAHLPDALRPRLEGDEFEEMARERIEGLVNSARCNRRHTTPRISGRTDGIPYRAHRIKSLGNTIDPQVSEVFATAIRQMI